MHQFGDAAKAIRWAEEYASRPDLGSQIGKLMKRSGSGDLVWDIAISISSHLACLEPSVVGQAAKVVYGVPDRPRDEFVANEIAAILKKSEAGKGKAYEKLRNLAIATIWAERRKILHGRRFPAKRMAKLVGVSRHQFITSIGWLELRVDALAIFRQWLKSADQQMTDYLSERGLLWEGDI